MPDIFASGSYEHQVGDSEALLGLAQEFVKNIESVKKDMLKQVDAERAFMEAAVRRADQVFKSTTVDAMQLLQEALDMKSTGTNPVTPHPGDDEVGDVIDVDFVEHETGEETRSRWILPQ